MAAGAAVGAKRLEIHAFDSVHDQPGEMVLGHPLAQPRRHQKRLLTTASDEVQGHGQIACATPDGAGVNATASDASRTGVGPRSPAG
jgi:hypothetical protein